MISDVDFRTCDSPEGRRFNSIILDLITVLIALIETR